MRLNADPSSSEPAKKPKAPRTSRGLGDLVKRITTALGVKPCGGCKKRADALNRATGKIRF